MSRIFLYPPLLEPADLDNIVCRLAWYFKPYLDKIEAIHFTSTRVKVDAVGLAPQLDPLVERDLPAIKGKIKLLDPRAFDRKVAEIDPARDVILIWKEDAENGASHNLKTAIKAVSSKSGFYRVDPRKTRMEGSFYLWAGMNKYADREGWTAQNHERMNRMLADIGQHEKAYVFGSGPSLSDFVDNHDFSDGLCIISNSIIKNPDIIRATRPRVITAADPLYHAGCSSYAGAFRTELISAMRETGAWFVCPMRDFAIYDTFLPDDLRDRIIGIPFNKDARPPTHLGETFHLHPYPNILTLALLPLASSLAKRIEIVGCDGRDLTDDGFFWSHDQKAQFNDKMAEIQAAHPAFFAIDYNDYYTDHCRDVEVVLSEMEEKGKTLVTATRSMIPALRSREPAIAEARANPAIATPGQGGTRTLVMIDPDAKGDWGHFLAYDKRLADGARANGVKTVLLARSELDPAFKPEAVDQILCCLSTHSWNLGKDWPKTQRKILMTFAKEMDEALTRIEADTPTDEICIFMYVGCIEVAEILEHLLVNRPRMRAVINLFWSYNFDQDDETYRRLWYPVMRRIHASPQVHLTHSTPQIAEEYRRSWNLNIPVLPHPSTTFSDNQAHSRAEALADLTPAKRPLRVVFPGGTRKEKGFLLSVGAVDRLVGDEGLQPVLRARLDKVSGPELEAAYAALDKRGIEILDGELSDDGFIQMIADADIVVIPYHDDAFRRRTSGILVDSFLLGKPVVVLRDTWLADIVTEEKIGLVAAPTVSAIAGAVRAVAENHATFTPGLRQAAVDYLAKNSWKALVALVIEASRAGPSPMAEPPVLTEKASAPLPKGDSPEALRARLKALIAQVPTKSPIYLPTEKISLTNQVAGMERVKRTYDEELETTYQPRMQALREQFKGTRRCFVIGNGPSLNKTDLSLLKDEVTFAVNGFFLKAEELDWTPTFYCVEDHLVAEDRVKWINEFKGPTKLFPAYLRYVFPQGEDTVFFNHRGRISFPHGFDFSTRADEVTYTGCTVTFTMLQLAFYFGFKEIYLIGVDADYEIPADAKQASDYAVGVIDMDSDDQNHFHPDYFGKGFRWHDPQVNKMVEAYQEARTVVDQTDQRIYNATVGGRLEVFERRDFDALFTPEALAAAHPAPSPKLLVLDITAMGNGSATGEIKSTLLRDWPADRLLQIADSMNRDLTLVRPCADGTYEESPTDRDRADAAIAEFDPDLILYRPVPNAPHLHSLAMDTIQRLNRPLATWVMDDWQARLAIEDPAQNAVLAPDLEGLLRRSGLCLSICDAMSKSLQGRYGLPFTALANGVDPADWKVTREHKAGRLMVRYAGGLAADMTLNSVLRVAQAVESLAAAGTDIRFEIQTRKFWFLKAGQMFKQFKHTHISVEILPAEQYAAWLAGADAVLIAYNFDEATMRYVQYSMANKMPECLASGAVVLAHGPRQAATIDYLASSEAAVVVEEESQAALETALRGLQADPARRADLARKGRALAFERHNVLNLRKSLARMLGDVVERSTKAGLDGHGLIFLDQMAQAVLGGKGAGARAPELLLKSCASALLLDANDTLARMNNGNLLGEAVNRAQKDLPADDPLRKHFARVLEHARAQAGT